jgi:hypothetical protein
MVSVDTRKVAERAAGAAREVVLATLDQLAEEGLLEELDEVGIDRAVRHATELLATELSLRASGRSALARRIGPVYAVEDLARWLPPAGAEPLTGEAVRKRAKQRRLVAFLTSDRQWAFPAWQFDRLGGRLLPRDDVIALWRELPTDGFLTDVDRAAWMATRMRSLGGATPAAYALEQGVEAQPLRYAVARLRRRSA